MKKLISTVLCLAVMLSLLSVGVSATSFSDVKSGKYYVEPVAWAVEQNVTTGYGDGTFRPDNTCTRAQIITFLWRAAGEPKTDMFLMNPYTDITEDAYYYEAALWAKSYGMVQGMEFKPNTPCTRAAAVEYIWRSARCPEADPVSFNDVSGNSDTAKAIYWAVRYGVTNGKNATTFDQKSTCTRGQIVTFLHRYFVEPLEFVETDPTPAKPADDMTLDPLPPAPKYYEKHPDWYMTLTPPDKMSNARIVAEMRQLDAEMEAWRNAGESVTLSMLVRSDDLTYNAMRRMEIVRRYDRGVNNGLSESARREYEELVAGYGDPQPLRD